MSEFNIRIMCPNLTCRKVLIVPSSSRGRTVRCRSCSTTIRVPEKNAPPVQASPPPADKPGETTAA